MKAHMGLDAESGLVHTVVGTAANVNWHVAMRPGKRKVLDKSTPMGAIKDQLGQVKAHIRAKVEHTFTLFALSNL